MRGCGRIERPAFPAPSEFQMRFMIGKTRERMRGEKAEACLFCSAGSRTQATGASVCLAAVEWAGATVQGYLNIFNQP